jgi:hypothetical protein
VGVRYYLSSENITQNYLSAILSIALLICACLSFITPIAAQSAPVDPFDVFASNSINKMKNSAGQSGLYFVNLRTGLSNVVVTNGTRPTLFNDGVLYQDTTSGVAMMAYPDGRTVPFSPIAITTSGPTMRPNWVISANGNWIAWTVSDKQELSLLSDLYVAAADVTNGVSNTKLVLHTSSTKAIDTVPLSVSNDGQTVFYARQASMPDAQIYQLFPAYSDIFKLDVGSGQTTELPGKGEGKNRLLAMPLSDYCPLATTTLASTHICGPWHSKATAQSTHRTWPTVRLVFCSSRVTAI